MRIFTTNGCNLKRVLKNLRKVLLEQQQGWQRAIQKTSENFCV